MVKFYEDASAFQKENELKKRQSIGDRCDRNVS